MTPSVLGRLKQLGHQQIHQQLAQEPLDDMSRTGQRESSFPWYHPAIVREGEAKDGTQDFSFQSDLTWEQE
jgi:hypothetical protein